MYTRLLAVAAAITAVVVVSAEQQPTTTIPFGRKARINDVPTPARFSGLRTRPVSRIDIDTTGLQLALPQTWAVDPSTGAQYRPGHVLVRFRTGVSDSLRMQTLQLARGRRVARSLPGNWTLVELDPGASAADSIRALRGRREVADATFNYRVRGTQLRPNDEFFSLQWNFDAINLPAAWGINPGSANDVVVAVIDSGLSTVDDTIVFNSLVVGQVSLRFAAVPDLVTSDRIVAPFDFIYDDDLPVDVDGHGTHVAGTIAQQTNNSIGVAGVAFNVKLMPLKVLADSSWDDIFRPGNLGGTDAIVAEAIQYAADHGAKVINLSLGGPGEAPVLREAIRYAVQQGAFVAIAAGNSGDEGNPVIYPAAYANEINGVMAVGAVARNLRRAGYSSFHDYVEICAPGGDGIDYEDGITQVGYDEEATLAFLSVQQKAQALILGLRPRFDQFVLLPQSGTSMAAPHVAGIAALLYSQGIRKPAAIEEAIARFAREINASEEDCGAGLVDPRRALRGLGLAR
jgi:serine protease